VSALAESAEAHLRWAVAWCEANLIGIWHSADNRMLYWNEKACWCSNSKI